MARKLHCGDVVAGCDGVVTGEDDQDVMRKAAAHAAEAHGIDDVDDDTAAALHAAIQDA